MKLNTKDKDLGYKYQSKPEEIEFSKLMGGYKINKRVINVSLKIHLDHS
jgi:hypothetical protein